MKMIQRYVVRPVNDEGWHGAHKEYPDAGGKYVRYADHSAALSSLQAKHDRLRAHLEIMTRGTQGEHRIPTMKEVEAARQALADEVTDERREQK